MRAEKDARNQKKLACAKLVDAILGIRYPETPEQKAKDPAHDPENQEQLLIVLEQVLDTLSDREKLVITSKFGIGVEQKTYEQLVDELDISKEAVRDIEIMALRKLRHPSRFRGLRNILEDPADVTPSENTTTTIAESDDIETLGLSVRTFCCLKRNGITTFGELMKMSLEELYNNRFLGEKSIMEIHTLLYKNRKKCSC